MFVGALESPDSKVLGSIEGIKQVLSGGKVLDTILGNVYVITLEIDVGTELGFLDVSFDGFNDGKLEGLLLGGSLSYTDGKVIGTNEGINMGYTGGKVLATILVNVYGITLGIDVGTELSSLDGSFVDSRV